KQFGKRDDDRRDSRRGGGRFEKRRDERPRGEKTRDEKRVAEKAKFEKREPSARLQGPLLWGFHAVRAAWLNKDRRVLRLLVTESALDGFQETLEASKLKRPQPEVIDKMLFERMLPAGAVHQG